MQSVIHLQLRIQRDRFNAETFIEHCFCEQIYGIASTEKDTYCLRLSLNCIQIGQTVPLEYPNAPYLGSCLVTGTQCLCVL